MRNVLDSILTDIKAAAQGEVEAHTRHPVASWDALSLSATQISDYDDCHRKWAWQKLDRVEKPQNKYAKRGEEIHQLLEDYLKTGVVPDPDSAYGKMLAPYWRHLPAPGLATIEGKFVMPTEAGTIVGFIDAQYEEDGALVIHDHKTTSDLRYALTEDELRQNVQSTIYGVHALESRPNFDSVRLRWGYVLANAKKPRVKIVSVDVHLSDIDRSWQRVLSTAHEMQSLYKAGKKALEIAYDIRACSKYGGCPFKKLCNLPDSERLKTHMTAMSLKDQMKARNIAKGINPPEATTSPAATPTPQPTAEAAVAPQAAPVQPVTSPPKNPLLAMMSGKAKAAQPVASAQPTAKADTPSTAQPVASAQSLAPATQVHPPLAAPPSYTLCIDSSPVKGEGFALVAFSTLITPVLSELEGTHGCHYRLAPNTYGGAPALIATELDNYLKEHPLPSNAVVVVDSGSVEGRDCLDTLIRHASRVFRAMR